MTTFSTDFRETYASNEDHEKDCLFCNLQKDDRKRIIAENDLAYAVRDGFAVTEWHTLFIPKRHVQDYFGLVPEEVNAVNRLMADQKMLLHELDPTIDGFNIGMNCGESAGQTIFHCHVHLIPRRKGDVENPRGGVRHIIQGKGFY
jgi:ATP adenylyltransferase